MRTRLATLALTALLIGPFVAFADNATMPADDQVQPDIGMGESQSGSSDTESRSSSSDRMSGQTINTRVVDIDGNRLVTETQKGDLLVFQADGPLAGLNVGDELEMRLDDQAKSAEILSVRSHEERS